ncbi:hypothetical protein SLE2022_255220 [Rubroshorea leprosula]
MHHGLTGGSDSGSGFKLPGRDEGRKRDNNDHKRNKRPWLHEETKDARKKLKAAKEELATSMELLEDLESGINQTRAENHLLLWEMALLDALVEDFLDDIDPQGD